MPATASAPDTRLDASDDFTDRHIGPSPDEVEAMLKVLDFPTPDALMDAVIPKGIRSSGEMKLPPPAGESEALAELRRIASKNKVFRSFIGMGYHGTVTPPVILRNILENPGWYTQYTPYQAEISQGRLEALLNFQTMVADLTGMEVANASMLDEATAAAEAMYMSHSIKGSPDRRVFMVSTGCHPQTIEVVKTRAWPIGVEVVVEDPMNMTMHRKPFGVLLQYPTTCGAVHDYDALIGKAHEADAMVTVAADPLALCLLKPPGELGADIAVGSTQRFGVPMGFGGPHAAYFATQAAYKRQMPGRIVGVSRDCEGRPALRLALQTREQHIRRDRATSNICTAQVLLAVMASMYAVYHGPKGLKRIAVRVHRLAAILAEGLRRMGYKLPEEAFFDTVRVRMKPASLRSVLDKAKRRGINLRRFGDDGIGVSLDETTTARDIRDLFQVFGRGYKGDVDVEALSGEVDDPVGEYLLRESDFLTHPVFNRHHSETEMLRYLHKLQARDLSLTHSMTPLGSCTMKLSAASAMLPVSWPEFSQLHPFAPESQAEGYKKLIRQLESWLAEITGFRAVSLQPNAGSQGELTGLLVIKRYHESRGEGHRKVCLIPSSAHGTNPASAALSGMRIVPVACDAGGDIDLEDLKKKAGEHAQELAAVMVTYPSTHGVFEEGIRSICETVHAAGGLVYLDGANLNAQVGYCRPGEYGADVCHLNLHKTFAIPHGGGGPGMGPIAVNDKLAPFLPRHPLALTGGEQGIGAVSAAPWGSPSILPISWMFIRMLGAEGLRKTARIAVLNANYVARRLEDCYPVLYKGANGLVAHECIVDPRALKASTGVLVDDIARRLMDHGFHAPTISFPVSGTMMIEPTESESKEELDRFVEALRGIHAELKDIESGKLDKKDNPVKNAPHTAAQVSADEWKHPYSRESAAYPSAWTREHKFWPPVSRIDHPYGDRNLICICPSVEEHEKP